MSLRAWVYIWSVMMASLAVVVLLPSGAPIETNEWITFALFTTSAIVSHFFNAKYGRQTYHVNTVFFFAGVILLPTPLYVLLIVIPHILEWIEQRLSDGPYLREWYIQPFNIATHIVSGSSAHLVYNFLQTVVELPAISPLFIAGVGAALTYAIVNHMLVGSALVLARSMSWQESSILDAEVIIPDAILLLVGYVVATLWIFDPWLILPAVSPLILMYRALMVPQLKKDAQTDQKTGLWNARHFQRLFQEEFQRAMRFDRPISVIMADMDLLRNINNNYGHLAGDVVIVGMAGLIKEFSREYDIAGRFGGEEFAIVLPETSGETALAIAERLRQQIEATEFSLDNKSTKLRATMSFGVASAPENASSLTELVHEADVALYQAKFRGRNRVVHAADVPHSFKLEFERSRAADNTVAKTSEVRNQETSGTSTVVSDETSTPEVTTSAPAVDSAPIAIDKQPATAPIQTSAVSQAAAVATEKPSPPNRALRFFVTSVIGTATLILLYGVLNFFPTSPVNLITLAILAVLSELLQVRVYERATVSVSATITLSAALLMGIPGVVATSSIIALMHYTKQRPPLYRLGFNWGVHMISGTLPALLFAAIPVPLSIENMPSWGIAMLFAGGAYYLLETGLVAAAIGLTERVSIVAKWNEQFRWLAVHYVTMGIMGLFLAVAYTMMGIWGIIAFVLPVVLVHHTQRMYVERTESGVQELRRMNDELTQANDEIAHASQAIRHMNEELLQMLAKVIDARDPDVSGHALQVSSYALAVAVRLGLSVEEVEDIRRAALLHDIGKLGIPERILHKPASLTDEEFALVKHHAALGADLLDTVQGLRHLAPFVRHHHERWDGTGYPDKLRANEIPLQARILAVCDVVEAMASDRPYQRARTVGEILAELERCAGTQFDPDIVSAFIHVIEEQGEEFIINIHDPVKYTLPQDLKIGAHEKRLVNENGLFPSPLPSLQEVS